MWGCADAESERPGRRGRRWRGGPWDWSRPLARAALVLRGPAPACTRPGAAAAPPLGRGLVSRGARVPWR
eukprot:9910577-Lingulodinium_polyedra.AAC.1